MGYTKGEWKVIDTGHYDKQGNEVWDVETTEDMIATTWDYDNAHLIAAAPKLYEALKECIDYFRNEIVEQYMKDETIPYFEGYKKGVLAIAKVEK